jgi:hypothetical protein
MPDIHIHRDHSLGLAKARKVAWDWAEQAESKFDMECTVLEGETSDTVELHPHRRDRHADRGGRPLRPRRQARASCSAPFSKTIEGEIEKNLDQLLDAQPRPPAKPKGAATKTFAARSPAAKKSGKAG